MAEITVSIIIDQTPNTVFEFAAHYPNDVYWRRGVTTHQLQARRASMGVTSREELKLDGMRVTTHAQVTEFEPGRRIAFVSTDSQMSGYREVEAIGTATRFIYHLEASEVPQDLAQQVQADTIRLKAILEAPRHHDLR